jgi:hypothetical protein
MLCRPPYSVSAELLRQRSVRQNAYDRIGDRSYVISFDEKATFSIVDGFDGPTGSARDDWGSASVRLQKYQAKSLRIAIGQRPAGQDEHVTRTVQLDEIHLFESAEERAMPKHTQFDRDGFQSCLEPPIPNDQAMCVRNSREDMGHSPEKLLVALASHQAPYRKDDSTIANVLRKSCASARADAKELQVDTVTHDANSL